MDEKIINSDDKLIAQSLFTQLLGIDFDNFKYQINKIYSSLNDKPYLSYNYEKMYEEKFNQVEKYYKDSLEVLDIPQKRKICDIFYSNNIIEGYEFLEKYQFCDQDYLYTLQEKIDHAKYELSLLEEKILNKNDKFKSFNDNKVAKLKKSISIFSKHLDDLANLFKELDSLVLEDTIELEFVENYFDDGNINIEKDEILEKEIESFNDVNFEMINNHKNNVFHDQMDKKFESIDISEILKMLGENK